MVTFAQVTDAKMLEQEELTLIRQAEEMQRQMLEITQRQLELERKKQTEFAEVLYITISKLMLPIGVLFYVLTDSC